MRTVRRRLPPALVVGLLLGQACLASAHPGHDESDPLAAASRPASGGSAATKTTATKSTPATSQGMVLATGLTVFAFAALVGLGLATRITTVPQCVSQLNSLGGGISTLFAWSALKHGGDHATDTLVAVGLSGLVGSMTCWGSLMVCAKLAEWSWCRRPFQLAGQQLLNGVLVLACLALTAVIATRDDPVIRQSSYVAIVILASVLGMMLVNPIGAADLPVVISLMTSGSGLAVAATGFVFDNKILIIVGSLVGASGVILTQIIAKAPKEL